MRHLGALNFLYNHRNLRLFDAQRFNISHQRSGLFVCVSRADGERIYVAQAHVCGTRACLLVLALQSLACVCKA